MNKYVSLKDIINDENYPFTKGQMNYFMSKRRQNGLLNAVRQIGKRIYIRLDLFNEWLESHAPNSYEDDESITNTKTNYLDMPLEDIEFTPRTRNCLIKLNVKTVKDICNFNKLGLTRIRNMGKLSIAEIEVKLSSMNLTLKEE